ncbi:hypothetical protein [Fredinandcohnia sp. 179-A 10B2 NHS]|uniref:hypothetical protein n=1 Tax=Fredinandcohnia sp. 179-A 10B2 NHS TaxID=3235176 RepID=UPI00399FA114
MLFTLSSCIQDTTSTTNKDENSTPVVTTDSAINTGITVSTEQNQSQNHYDYLAKNKGEISEVDFETAYEMCMGILNDYYKAVWNGSNLVLDTYIDNDNLKQYTQKKIQAQHDAKGILNDNMQDIEIGDWEVDYTDDVNGGFLYLKLPVEIKKDVGSYGENNEFLVRNINGKLVIVDWYTDTKDSYDFLVRGENQTIDKPTIWNDLEWVKKIHKKQLEFSGSTR